MMRKKTVRDYEEEANRTATGCLIPPYVKSLARKLYIMRHGPLGKGICVCHTCDNGWCIEDAHHFAGTQIDNIRDAMEKGRVWGVDYRKKVIPLMGVAARKRAEDPEYRKKLSRAATELWKITDFRKRQNTRKGEAHQNSKLTDAEALEIKRRYKPGTGSNNRGNVTALSKEFGVSKGVIRAAGDGTSYSHLNDLI